jgi:hypothetical protein
MILDRGEMGIRLTMLRSRRGRFEGGLGSIRDVHSGFPDRNRLELIA